MSIEGAYPGVNFSEIHCGEGTVFNSRTELAGQRNVFSYTSPVYATVNGKPIRSWDDHLGYMQHAIDWLNNGGTIRQRRGRKSSIAAFEQAGLFTNSGRANRGKQRGGRKVFRSRPRTSIECSSAKTAKHQRRRIGRPPASLLRWAASMNAMISSVSSGATGGIRVWKNFTICFSNGP
jgi:hypothetical protein